jgi:uncharacterized protein YegL
VGVGYSASQLLDFTGDQSRVVPVDKFTELDGALRPIKDAVANHSTVPRRCDGRGELDVMIAVDQLNSHLQSSIVRSWLAGFAERLNLGKDKLNSRMGVVKYSSYCVPAFNLADFQKKLKIKQAVEAITFTKVGASIPEGMACAKRYGFDSLGNRKNAPDVLVILSNGHGSTEAIKVMRETLEEKGIKIIAVAAGSFVKREGLLAIAGDEKRVYQAPKYDVLDQIFKDICVAVETPVGCCFNGGLAEQCECKAGFTGKYCETALSGPTVAPLPTKKCVPKPIDVAFVLDGSGSVGIDNFNTTLKFLADMTSSLTFHSTDLRQSSRVGMIQFTSQSFFQFGFNQFRQKEAVKDQILKTVYEDGGTNIANGMKGALDKIFTKADTRQNFPKFMMVLTDGDDSSDVISQRINAEKQNITVLAIGIGSGVRKAKLLQIAGSKKRVHEVADFKDLSKIIGSLCVNLGRSCCENGGLARKCKCTKEFEQPYCLKEKAKQPVN